MLTDQSAYNFFVNGFIHAHLTNIELIDFDQFTFVDCALNENRNDSIDEAMRPLLVDTWKTLEEQYVSKLFSNYQLHEMNMWQGVDKNSTIWHNDYTEHKTFNSNILVYLDDSCQLNTIEVKSATEEFVIYPNKGDVVWLNQTPTFEHRAKHINGQRRLMSFEIYIDDLWT